MFQNASLAFATLAIAGLLAAAAPARAEDPQTRTTTVRASDLDLHTADGQAALRHRVKLAAGRVCGPAESIGSSDFASYDSCLHDAQTTAMHRADAMIASVNTRERLALATPTN